MTTFEELGLKPETMRAIKDMKFEKPSNVQERAYPLLAQGKDLIVRSHTGSGKTVAFGIHLIENIEKTLKRPQAIILVPTRELAVQVTEELVRLAKYHGTRITTIYGGASINRQADELRRGAQIIVGTPGRTLDMLRRGALNLRQVKMVVLDEADRMLDMGFIDDVTEILKDTPTHRQTTLFSATMPDAIVNLTHRYMDNPEQLLASEDAIPLDKINQSYVLVEHKKKNQVLEKYLKSIHHKGLILIFTRTKYGADKLSHFLRKKDFKSTALHGNLSQNQRDRAMNSFRKSHVDILVATDIASRGIDVLKITHVINYDLPDEPETYSHRVGRTARAGAEGDAISFVVPDQHREWKLIETINQTKVQRVKLEGSYDGEWKGGSGGRGGRRGHHPSTYSKSAKRGRRFKPRARRWGGRA